MKTKLNKPTEIEKAKQILREAGYFVDNLWHVDDVKAQTNCTDDEQAQEILSFALTDGYITEQIFDLIITEAAEQGLKQTYNF